MKPDLVNASRFLSALFLLILPSVFVPAAAAAANRPTPEIIRGFETPLIAFGEPLPEEHRAMEDARQEYMARGDLTPLVEFLNAYPRSVWKVSLYTNIGMAYRHQGYYSRALDALRKAVPEAGKRLTVDQQIVVDYALARLLHLHASLGQFDDADNIMKEIGTRTLIGPATEYVTHARETLWLARNEPASANRCGVFALGELLRARSTGSQDSKWAAGFRQLEAVRSGRKGIDLWNLLTHANRAGMEMEAVHRIISEEVPVPSIVHWKTGHYAAILKVNGDLYLVRDSALNPGDHWIHRDAIDEESTGYFLAYRTAKNSSWRRVARVEGEKIHGAGSTTQSEIHALTTEDSKDCSECDGAGSSKENAGSMPQKGMPRYAVHSMLVSLNIEDTPLGYVPPKGPAIPFTLSYIERDATQPASFYYSNVGQKWTHNWLSLVADNPVTAGASVVLAPAGGGLVYMTAYNSSTGAFAREVSSGATLVRVSGSPIVYERRFPDGSIHTYAQSDGHTAYPRRIFLTQVRDPSGNAVTLQYDSQLRLTSVTDAIGQVTTMSYGSPSAPLRITGVSDPFGRSISIGYDGSGRLNSITDAIGMTSTFQYGSTSVSKMTTPYGDTIFTPSQSGMWRSISITDPAGQTERVDFRHTAPGLSFSDPAGTPTGMTGLYNQYQNYRNSFYWDKSLVPVTGYANARIKHFMHHNLGGSNYSMTSHLVETMKFPLESRIWYNYLGQTDAALDRVTLDRPVGIGRLLDDGSTQLIKRDFNALGNVTKYIDAVGRETHYDYAPNDIDVIKIRQKTVSSFDVIAEYTYNSQHLPLTFTDAAGQTTTYTYNAAGQPTTTTNPSNEVTTYQYDGNGYLMAIINAANQTERSFTYDSAGRVATETDSEGHVLSYAYDNLDRLVSITYPDATTQTYMYDKLDVVTQKDRLNQVTAMTYDAARNLKTVTDPLNRVTQYGYFPNGRLKTLTDPNGNVTRWDRDLEGRVTKKTFPDNTFMQFTYDLTSRLKTTLDAKSQTRQYAYGKDDNLSAITYLNAQNPTPNVTFAYDTYYSRRTSMNDGTGATTYAYVPVGTLGALQVASETAPGSNTQIQHTYDQLGRLATRIVDGGSMESFAYDNLGRVTTVGNPLGVFDYAYLGQTDQLTSQLLTPSGGTSSQSYKMLLAYGNNIQDRRLQGIQHTAFAGDGIRDQSYVSQPETGIIQRTDTAPLSGINIQQAYQYDAANRLSLITRTDASGVTLQSYTQDPADNLTSIQESPYSFVATPNGNNQVQGYTYDLNGNLLDDGQRTYQWDAQDRLTQITGTVSGTVSQFKYDGLDRRVAILEQASVGGPVTETRYLWCGSELCQTRDASDTVTGHYYSQGQIKGAQTSYYARDHLGSVIGTVDSSGNPTASAEYTAFGRTLTSSGTQPEFGYAGMFRHQPTGLYLTLYRTYNPSTGRWLSRDPIGEEGGTNLYTYVEGSPLNFSDPFGLAAAPPEPPGPSPAVRIDSAIKRGDVDALESMMEALSPNHAQLARAGIQRLKSKASDIIAKECKGSINREFPEQFRDMALKDIMRARDAGDDAARKALKLLTDKRFKK